MEDLVRELVLSNHEVTVLTYQPLTTNNVKWKIFESSKNLQIIRIPWLKGLFYKLLSRPVLELVYLLPALTTSTLFTILIKRPKVIHAHGLIAAAAAIPWAKISSTRLVVSTHAVYGFDNKSSFSKFAAFIFKHSNFVLCLSAASQSEVISLGIKKDKTDIFNNWINTNVFKPATITQNSSSKKDALKVIFVGRLIAEKGIPQLLDAAKLLSKKDNVKMIIAGNGPLEELVRNSAKSNFVEYIGSISNEKLPSFYNNADITIMPSTHEEGFGRVVLESFATGTPVIASKRGELKKLIDQTRGYFTETDSYAIAESLKKISKDRLALKQKSEKCREFVIEKYGPSNVTKITRHYD